MSIKLLKQVNFGESQAGATAVGFTLLDADGVVDTPRSTTGVHEVGTSTGIFAAQVTFDTQFSGSILWDTGGGSPVYAAEQYNPTAENIEFVKDIEGGRWMIDNVANQMIFYKSDNLTEVARFGLSGSAGLPTVDQVFRRNREDP